MHTSSTAHPLVFICAIRIEDVNTVEHTLPLGQSMQYILEKKKKQTVLVANHVLSSSTEPNTYAMLQNM
jgi:hypothetical protein